MGIRFAENWNCEAGLKAKHGEQYADDYDTLGCASWQQMSAMLITWANRELREKHAQILKDLAATIKSPDSDVTVQLGFHQCERFDGEDYFHITVLNPAGSTVHMFSRVKNWFGNRPDIEKSFWGGSTSPSLVEERYRYIF